MSRRSTIKENTFLPRDRSFENYLQEYRRLEDKLGTHEKWRHPIELERLEIAQENLPEPIKLAIKSFVLLNKTNVDPRLKTEAVKCMKEMWEMVQIEKITPVMGRDLIDWVELLSEKVPKGIKYKDKIEESYWRLERTYRHFNSGPENEDEIEEIRDEKDFLLVTYFVQKGIKFVNQEAFFDYNVFMSKCELILCLLRRIEVFVQSESLSVNRPGRIKLMDAIYMTRRSFGEDAWETLNFLPSVQTIFEAITSQQENTAEAIDIFKQEVDHLVAKIEKNLKRQKLLRFRMYGQMEQLDAWKLEQIKLDWTKPISMDNDMTVDFNLIPECDRNTVKTSKK